MILGVSLTVSAKALGILTSFVHEKVGALQKQAQLLAHSNSLK